MDAEPPTTEPLKPELSKNEPPKIEKRWTRRKTIILATALVIGLALSAVCMALWQRSSTPESVTQTTTAAVKTAPLVAPKIGLVQYATGLKNPSGIVATGQATDTRLFAVDQSGIIRIIKKGGSVATEPFLDIRDKVTFSGEMGLLGLAFSPNYATDGTFFMNYIDKGQNTIIARYKVSANADKADVASSTTVFTLKQPYPNHNGGDLAFGPDGYLYVALGDGGSAADPENRAQNLGSLFGKLLRLDVSSVPYKVPADNPFVGRADAAPEIWAYGLRNPWRISFDSKTHDLYIGDVGQDKNEEINVEAAGSKGGNNYGWRCYEGNDAYSTVGCKNKDQYAFPAAEYDHTSDRCSITGGYVYHGTQYPALDGKYFYADYCNGELSWLEKQGTDWKTTKALETSYNITTFGVDNGGEIYVADGAAGTVYHLTDTANAPR